MTRSSAPSTRGIAQPAPSSPCETLPPLQSKTPHPSSGYPHTAPSPGQPLSCFLALGNFLSQTVPTSNPPTGNLLVLVCFAWEVSEVHPHRSMYRPPFLFRAARPSVVGIKHIRFTGSSCDGDGGCFYPRRRSQSCINVHVHVSIRVSTVDSSG